jgi:Sir2- and TIR-associating SLOG family/SIR2-like domain
MATVDEFVETYSQALADRNAAIMAGAGLSIPAGLVNWKGLMRSIAKEIGLDVEKETDLIAVAQYHLNERGGRQRINQTLVSEFSERAKISENHSILARLPIGVFWTTNYDNLIEGALRKSGKRVDIKITPENLATTLPRRDVVLYKMHGDISDPTCAVVSKDDYESYGFSRRGQLFSTALRGDLVSKTFLFLGFSFSDPNVDYILGRVRVLLEGNRREHYCLMRSVHRADFTSNRDFQYARTKQELQVRDLRRYGIMPVLLQSFTEYTETLKRLERRHKGRQVFISGSAHSFSPWSESDGQKFLTQLSSRLTKGGMNVITGFGLGVGPHIINGVLDELEKEGTRNLSDRLTLRPFPYAIADPQERRVRWANYRREMISKAGVAIFVFGNKLDAKGDLVPADGMLDEFKIAQANGLLVVPVGSTGYASKTIYDSVSADISKNFPEIRGLKTALSALAKPGTPHQTVDKIVHFLDLLAKAKPS